MTSDRLAAIEAELDRILIGSVFSGGLPAYDAMKAALEEPR